MLRPHSKGVPFIAVVLVAALPLHAGVSVELINFPGRLVTLRDMSANGDAVTGFTELSTNGLQAYRWSRSGGVEMLKTATGDVVSGPYGISGDGNVVVGRNGASAFRWSPPSNYQPLGFIDPAFPDSRGLAASFDGSVVVGTSEIATGGEQGFIWSEATGMFPIVGQPGSGRSQANDVSADGTRVVGANYTAAGREAIIWDDGSVHLIPRLAGFQGDGFAIGISHDGELAVGAMQTTSGNREAFLYSVATDQTISLGDLQHPYDSIATGVSDSGVVIGVSRRPGDNDVPFIWDENNGMRVFSDALEQDYGLDLSSLTIRDVTAISDDGMVFAGEGSYDGVGQVGWVITVPAPGSVLFVVATLLGVARRRRHA